MEQRKAWLRRYVEAKKLERELNERFREMRARACALGGGLSLTPGAKTGGQSIPLAIERMDRARLELLEQVERACDAREEVAAVIDTLEDMTGREILSRRYLLGQRWDEIAQITDREQRYLIKLHNKAVSALAFPQEESGQAAGTRPA